MQSIDGKPHLVVDNPSPYYFTFNQLTLISPKGSEKSMPGKWPSRWVGKPIR